MLGMEAYLIGYVSPKFEIGFAPPFGLSILGWSPFMATDVDWERRTVTLSVQSFWRKIAIQATAPKGTFLGLSAPFIDGFKWNFLAESFQASVDIQIFKRSWLGSWDLVLSDRFGGATLEFGGDIYPMRGSDRIFN